MIRFCIVVALIATMLPVVYVLDRVGGIENWQGVPPQGITDSLYYYARMHEVMDGHPLVGNPFAFEYRHSNSPGSFVPDVLSAFPLLLGLPLTPTIILNVFMWTFVFLILTTKLLSALKVGTRWIMPITVLVYVSSYAFMLRPTIMQTIFPLFLLFLIVILLFLYEPLSQKRSLWLACVSALTFYFYNFLAFFVFVTCSFLFIWFLVRKQYRELKALVITGLYTFMFLIPFLLYSLFQLNGSLYEETLVRIGMVYTHIPAIEAFFFGRWVALGLGAFMLLSFCLRKHEAGYAERRVFWITTGFALSTCLVLNVITGVEFTLAIHVGRLVVVWTALLFGVLLYEWYTAYFYGPQRRVWVHVAVGVCVLFLAVGVAKNLPRAVGFFNSDNRDASYREVQEYAGPLAWLKNNVIEESVIWSNTSIGGYVPIMTKHYLLFHNAMTIQTAPSKEIEERYLLWRSLGDVSIHDVKNDFGMYVGAGKEKEQPLAYNNAVRFCTILAQFIVRTCPQKTDAMTLQGEVYFENLIKKFDVIKAHRTELLMKYNVKYLIVDTNRDTFTWPLSTSTAVYADDRFFIYSIESILE